MERYRSIHTLILLLFLAGTCISCDSSSGSNGSVETLPVVENTPLYGTWAGYFMNDVYDPDDTESALDPDENDLFIIGIITPGANQQVRLIGDVSQFISDDLVYQDTPDYYLRKEFGGHLAYYTWNTLGMNWNTLGLNSSEDYYLASTQEYTFYGNTVFTTALLSGLYWPFGTNNLTTSRQFQMFNYNESGVAADINDLKGHWRIENSFKGTNVLTFTISKQTESLAVITGSDGLDNRFDGTIEIRYSEYSNAPIFSVDMTMNDEIELEGLATYIETFDTQGIEVERTLAIGVTDKVRNSQKKHLITGLATQPAE